jgi:hypothetical protein
VVPGWRPWARRCVENMYLLKLKVSINKLSKYSDNEHRVEAKLYNRESIVANIKRVAKLGNNC